MTFPFAAGQIPSAGAFGEGPTVFTPVLGAGDVNPNLGANGSASGWWVRIGPTWIQGTARFHFDGTGADTGQGLWRVFLPLPADVSVMAANTSQNANADPIGNGRIRAVTPTSDSRLLLCYLGSAHELIMIADGTNSRLEGGNVGNVNRLWVRYGYIIEPGT